MGIIQRNRTVTRCAVAALWLLGFIAAISTEIVPLLYVLPILALLSFFLADYFSGFVIAILLTAVMKTIYPDQVSSVTRALLIDVVWITAIVTAGIKLLKPAPVIDKETSGIIKYQLDELPVNIRHDLQSPISMILGFCNAILRADSQGSTIPPLYRDNVQAIYRNAQQLEKMIGDILNRSKTIRIPDAEELEPAILIKETVALIQDLMTAHRITLEIKISNPLPNLALHRITIRQVLLNVLRTMARVNSEPEFETFVTIQATVQESALHITFTALRTIIQRVRADANWSLNERLLKSVGGRLEVEAIADPNLDSYCNVVLVLPFQTIPRVTRPIPSGITDAVDDHRVLVISEESNVIDLFKEYLSQYEVIGIKDINTLYRSAIQERPAAVILTREQHMSHLQKISHFVGKHTPIIVCTIATAEEQLRRLNLVYLPKPVDYDTLFAILASAKPPIGHILIVDDNNDSADMLAQMLLVMSPTFVSWKSCLAKDALVLLDQHPIGAIILDIFLPDMEGIALAQLIRADERFAHLPIVLVSAHQNLDFMEPVIDSDRLSVFQPGGFDSGRFATYVEALVKVAVVQ